jgi:hypothetical protein
MPRSAAPATIAAASGCSLPRSRLAANWRSRRSSPPSSPSTVTSFGLPSVSVPVLSTISASTLHSDSIAPASLNSTPSPAPIPLATMMDMGVASPSAHGQAMISTATALTSAWDRRGSGPTHAQIAKVTAEIPITIGTK